MHAHPESSRLLIFERFAQFLLHPRRVIPLSAKRSAVAKHRGWAAFDSPK